MISYKKLGYNGRLGNQIFQYAFLRFTAEKLGVRFYCPKWIGDSIFSLNDENQRSLEVNTKKTFLENKKKSGFLKEATLIQDDTDILGYFQTYKYFKKQDVLKWFSFKKEYFLSIENKYKNINFEKSCAIHLRLGDYLTLLPIYYTPKPKYFKKALMLAKHKENIIVFSDDVYMARKYLSFLSGNVVFIEGNKDEEDFYLMSKCHDIICSSSSFSWWAGYLNSFNDKIIIFPKRWFSVGSPIKNTDLYFQGCITVKAHRFLLDNFFFKIPFYIKNKFLPKVIARILRRLKTYRGSK